MCRAPGRKVIRLSTWAQEEYCAPVWMSFAESHLNLLDSAACNENGYVTVNFVVWGAEGRSVPCACYIRFFTEQTTFSISICIILLQLVILELQLLVS